jgi:hypothetical protein
MSKLIPDAGMLFYAEPTWHLNDLDLKDGILVLAKSKSKDRSYSEKVMRCIASDDRSVIAEVAWGQSFGKDPRMFNISEYAFSPVGPDVVNALGLNQETKQSE